MDHLIVTHIDLDGVGCFLYLNYFNIGDEYLFINYDEIKEYENYILSFKEVWFTDLNIEESLLQKLIEKGIKIKIFDHHEGTKNLISYNELDNVEIWYKTNSSGCSIIMQYFNRRMPYMLFDIITIIDIYDRYDKENSRWQEADNLNRLLWKSLNYGNLAKHYQKYSFFIRGLEYKIKKYPNKSFFFYSKEEKKIQESLQDEINDFIQAKKNLTKFVDSKGVVYGIWMGRRKISAICNRLLEDDTSMTYIYCVNCYGGAINGKIHLRSLDKNDFSCLNIKGFRGHIKAAAIELSPEEAKDFYLGKRNFEYEE